MTRRYERTDDWYDQARDELHLMKLLDEHGPATLFALAKLAGLSYKQVNLMLCGLCLAECVAGDRKTGKFRLLPAEASQQLALELE